MYIMATLTLSSHVHMYNYMYMYVFLLLRCVCVCSVLCSDSKLASAPTNGSVVLWDINMKTKNKLGWQITLEPCHL